MKVAIIGSRSAGDTLYALLEQSVPLNVSEIISGGANGVDRMAERFARLNNLRLTVHLPDYETFGKTAPLIRNAAIVNEADYIVALWDCVSRGTANVINLCIEKSKPFKIIKI
jgi:hypothetical protein